MKILAGGALALGVLTGCGPAKQELHVYTWSDYIDPGVITQFEAKNNCRVIVDTFDSNEAMFAKLQAGSTGYDIIMPTSYQIPVMVANKMIRKLDHTKLPNVKQNFDQGYYACMLDKTMTYNVPYAVTLTGFSYRKDKTAGAPVDSWNVFTTSALKGRMSLLSDMRETIGAALKSLGYSLNSEKKEEIDAAVKVVLNWKKNIAKFDNEQYKTAVASGEWFVGHGYSSDIIQTIMDDDKDAIGFTLPKEGFTVCCDEMVIAADAPQPDLAHAFINFLYGAETCKENMASVCAPMPCAPAMKLLAADPETAKLASLIAIDAKILAKGEVLKDFDNNPEVRKMYIDAWDRIKAGE
jgi:spermidine/putrescine transport system substrate-binding protein